MPNILGTDLTRYLVVVFATVIYSPRKTGVRDAEKSFWSYHRRLRSLLARKKLNGVVRCLQ